jgi:xylan 1,4-beta-xylosidase
MQDDGTVDVLVWNGTINVALMGGDPRLNRRLVIAISGLGGISYRASLARVDEHHSNIVARCPAELIWPDAILWNELRAADRLHDEQLPLLRPERGTATFELQLPMPGVARIRLSPYRR